MRKIILFIFCFSFLIGVSQNWNVFNRSYRYNYCFNNSPLISNVLFTLNVTNSGADTLYNLNLIGTPCIKGCPTLTASVGSSTFIIPKSRMIVPDQPQFLQRKIKKFSNGTVMLYDTTSMVIQPNCSVGQTWIFDSLNSVNATCNSTYTKTVFSMVDSIKRILLSTGDTILLSKQFGLIQFPLPYSNNKYFVLKGIEKLSSYDPTALYGQKVPNFWDFYNFGIGDEFYYKGSKCDNMGSPAMSPLTVSVYQGKSKVLAKQINSNSITYTFQTTYQSNYASAQPSCYIFPGVVTNTTSVSTYFNTDPFSVSVNKMYPGLLDEAYGAGYISPVSNTFGTYNLITFLNDLKGRFTKKTGFYCPSSANPPINDTFIGLKYYSSLNLLIPSNYYGSSFGTWPNDINQKIFTVGLGNVRYEYEVFEHEWHNCLLSAVIGVDTLFGPMPAWGFGVGITETVIAETKLLYPNPADKYVKLPSVAHGKEISVTDILGKKMDLYYTDSGKEIINTEEWREGVYFISIRSVSEIKTYKLIVSH